MFELSHSSSKKEGVEEHYSLKAHSFLILGVCLKKIPLWKIVEPPWKEGEIRLEVDKVVFA